MSTWSPERSEELYNVANWGGGYFRVNAEGNVSVLPRGPGEGAVDLRELVDAVRRRGIELPVLFRFPDVLRARVAELRAAYARATEEYGFEGAYRPVFPIKVNQQRPVVDAIRAAGGGPEVGLEVGSKPELLAVFALHAHAGALMVCNGYKDREYVELALLSSRLGVTPVLVVEKYTELVTILRASEELGIRPVLGVRTKLGGPGAGRWRESGGDRSKFGLTTRQIVQLVDELRERDMLDCLRCLHFHLGSQITDIRSLKTALREATRTFVGLHELGAPVEWFDVGGGLGVDYDGSSTRFEASMNYSLQEYANDVVFQVAEACREASIPPPTILTESGRALTAHHAVLVSEVIGVADFTSVGEPAPPAADEHASVRDLAELGDGVTSKSYQEAWHDAIELRDEAMMLFNTGQLSLAERARVEEFYWRVCARILEVTQDLEYVPDELQPLAASVADTYFVNASVFQSIPDTWAIGQLFPILPIHRLGEEPTRRGTLADLTCDSDGKVDRFIDLHDVKRLLELHPLRKGEPYYLGIFLVGAYQETLGDLHNLFGDTHVVSVELNGGGRPRLVHVQRGERVQDVLEYVQYRESDLLASLRENIERAIEEDRLGLDHAALLQRRYVEALAGYTYLVRDDHVPPYPSANP